MNENLYLIIPFFNFNDSKERLINFDKCIKNLQEQSNVKIIVIEGYLKNKNPQLEVILSKYNLIYNYVSYELPSILWVKENLINKACSLLPIDWEYMAWIDGDVIFSSNITEDIAWGSQTVELLKKYDTVQLFKLYAWIHGKNHGLNVGMGFAFISKLDMLEFGHPGFAWAINKNFYKKIGGLFEYCIIGGFDGLYSAILRKLNDHLDSYYALHFGDYLIKDYYSKFDNVNYSYNNSTLLHLPHGDLLQRKYHKRYSILKKYDFNPIKDLTKNDDGILGLKDNESRLALDIKDYFLQRGD
jgi:hypothetical protein